VSVLYPNTPGSRFDRDYYVEKHSPLVRERWSDMGLTELRLLHGTGAPDGSPAAYQVIALLSFTSAEALQAALGAHGAEILGDVPRFTDVQPLIQVNAPLG
jgi:uncharacterized protein (TIGR02118 family)